MSKPRSRPLPPHLPPLVEQVRLRELKSSPAALSSVSPMARQNTHPPRPRQPVKPPSHPLLEQVADIEAMPTVLLSALEQENTQAAHHHTRLAKHILRIANDLSQDLNILLSELPSTESSQSG